jgi:hypothetical protein
MPSKAEIETKKPKPPTAKQYQAAWMTEAAAAIDIRPCRRCKWPVVEGYCCTYCESRNP